MKRTINLILLILFAFTLQLKAQTDTNDTKPIKMFQKATMNKFMEYVKTDEATTVKYFKMYRNNLRKINQFTKLRRSVMSDIESNPEDADISNKLDKLNEIETNIYKVRSDFRESLKEYLTPIQIAKSLIFEKKLRQTILENRK